MADTKVALRRAWMDYLQSQGRDPSLMDLTIPGTHDTGTWTISRGSASRCQAWTLEEQLNNGIRFIDIRLVPKSDSTHPDDLRIYHARDNTGIWFSDVIETCKQFLHDNSGETVIMSIKNEHDVNIEDFSKTLDPWLASARAPGEYLFHVATTVPTLSAVRGQIVLVRRYDYPPYGTPGFPYPVRYGQTAPGIDAVTGWPQDNWTTQPTSGSPPLMVQDVFRMSITGAWKKWDSFIRPFFETAATAWSGTWFFNFTSTSGGMVPSNFAQSINSWLQIWLEEKAGQRHPMRLGTVPMDFPSPRTIDLLILLNLPVNAVLIQNSRGFMAGITHTPRCIVKAYTPAGWHYAQAGTGMVMPHALLKIGGNADIGYIYPGDTVMIQSTEFTNDEHLYLEGIGYTETGGQLYYCKSDGWKFGETMVQWQVTSADGGRAPNERFELNDKMLFRNLSTQVFPQANGYLYSQAGEDYLGTATLPTPGVPGDLLREDFMWVMA